MLLRTRDAAARRLLDERDEAGHWVGELSTSALSTATAAMALCVAARELPQRSDELLALAHRGLAWLVDHANADGGFGDTTESPSNISTTTLCWVAFGLAPASIPVEGGAEAEAAAQAWMERHVGSTEPAQLARHLLHAYGDDLTFSVPILCTCAIGGRLGEGKDAWASIPALPFELAVLPHRLFQFLGLPMVSYALPALIAIGQAIHHHHPSDNPVARIARKATRSRTLEVLTAIQPSTGGFLEATPLTSFVTLSLAASGQAEHPVVTRALAFLVNSVRTDGSWPIDTNLSTWVTTLSVQALGAGGRAAEHLGSTERGAIAAWLSAQQYTAPHPYTHAAPGGWAWTDLAGGVPDADDTPGALLALHGLGNPAQHAPAARAGVGWLLDLANQDGGTPTFCRGWGKLPFDRSSPDLTAHALRAYAAWQNHLDTELTARVESARRSALAYLVRGQRGDGAWVPLWFGNQHAPALENPVYGTARVLMVEACLPPRARTKAWVAAVERAVRWLLAAQHEDGAFGGAPDTQPSIEETALAVEALAALAPARPDLAPAALHGADWLARATHEGTDFPATPIGLYFAKLWYSERLYPLIFTVAALERCARLE